MRAELAVITASYGPDAELFADSHASVLRNTPQETVHYVAVPDQDLAVFGQYESSRCRVVGARDLLPRHFRSVPGWNGWLNVRRPWPPLRGWVAQQLLKIGLAQQLDARCVLVLDSDIVLVRAVTARTFMREGGLLLYKKPDAVHAGMPRHVRWHSVAREMLGLPEAAVPLDDYVGPLVTWDPVVVRALTERVEMVTRRRWQDWLARQLHFSEFILYGIFAEEFRGGVAGYRDSTLCHGYWDEIPLDLVGAKRFVAGLPPDDVAIMISAQSHTPLHVRREALRPYLPASTLDPRS